MTWTNLKHMVSVRFILHSRLLLFFHAATQVMVWGKGVLVSRESRRVNNACHLLDMMGKGT